MSLTSEIDNAKSPIGAFFRARFPNTRAIVAECNRSLREAETICPAEQIGKHFGTLGTAIDYRLRYYFPATPSQELIAWRGAKNVSDKTIWERSRPPVKEIQVAPWWHHSLMWHRSLIWNHNYGPVNYHVRAGGLSLPKEAVVDFFRNLDAALADLQPAGRKLNHNDESLINRYCVVLALFEQCFRVMPRPESPLFTAYVSSADDLLQIAPAHWIDDLCAMSELFYDQMESRFTEDAILNPTFDGSAYVRGADADMILGSCLIDFKTTINAKIKGIGLYQLLGYCLLDFTNQYQIERVGFYLPRQGRFIAWHLEDLIQQLSESEPAPIVELRSEFGDVIGFPMEWDN